MEDLFIKIKEYRVKLDKMASVMLVMPKSREISIAVTSVQNAKMWLGKTLQYIGSDNPYPDSKNPINTIIEPPTDKWVGDLDRELNGIAHIQKVKQLRKELTDIYIDIEKTQDVSLDTIAFHTVVKAWDYVVESNMWLGMELGRIYEDKKNKNNQK